jgi:hypothetical protein
MRLFRRNHGSSNEAPLRHPQHLLIAREVERLASRYRPTSFMHGRLMEVARMVEADPDAAASAGEALLDVLLEVAGEHAGPAAVTRLRASHPALAMDDIAHGFVEGSGPILDEETMRGATRVLIALDPAHFEAPRFASAEDAFSTYQRELTVLRRTQRFADQEGQTSPVWQRQIAKQADAVRTARASWRAAVERAMIADESPVTPDHAQREAAGTRGGEEMLEHLARRYGRAAAREVRAAAVAADDGCELWSNLVHGAAQTVLGDQFEAERWQTMAAMENRDRPR